MSDSGETTRILNAESKEVLKRSRDAEISKIMKLRLILAQIRNLRVSNCDVPDDSGKVVSALKFLSIRNHLRLNNGKEDQTLGIVPPANVSYTERKAIRQRLIRKLQSTYQPVADFKTKMRREFPELFVANNTSFNNSITTVNTSQELTTFSSQFCELESQRYKNSIALVEIRNRKCSLMKVAAELKAGPYPSHVLELLCSDLRESHSKAALIRSHIIDNLVKSSDHSYEAFKEVAEYIDQNLDNCDE